MPEAEKTPRTRKDHFLASAARYTAAATSLPASVAAGYFIGKFLDNWLGTTYLYIVFLLLGIASGFLTLVRVLMRDMKDK